MDELEGMNMLLRAIGSSPVNAVTTNHPDAANARTTLDRIRLAAQKRGWWFNIDYDYELSPAGAFDQIAVTDDVKKIVFVDRNLAKRSGKVYDKLNQTYAFTAPVCVKYSVRMVPWDDMPMSAQLYCAYLAAAEFIRDELEDKAKADSFRKDAGIHMFDMKKEDLEAGQYNSFRKPRVSRARRGVRPVHLGYR